VQIEVEDGELDVGLEDLADPPWIKDGRVFARQALTRTLLVTTGKEK
jgi:hypothetical protein